MPSLNFHKRFADQVERLVKRQTIRRRRKHPIKVGDPLYLYTGMRTKACRKLGQHVAIGVHSFFIDDERAVYVDGDNPSLEYLERLAIKDGFTDVREFIEWFVDQGLPFDGQLIRW